MPTSIAFTASSLDIAGPFAMLSVPYLIFLGKTPGLSQSVAIPISTGYTSAPLMEDIIQIVALCFVIFSVTVFVTSCPVWVTPSATTPLSAAMTITAFFLKCGFLSR